MHELNTHYSLLCTPLTCNPNSEGMTAPRCATALPRLLLPLALPLLARAASPLQPNPDQVPSTEYLPEANFELSATTGYDVPLSWSHIVPIAGENQSAPPLFEPDGGIVHQQEAITLGVDGQCCGGRSPDIYYTLDGTVPIVHESKRYTSPFRLQPVVEWAQPRHVMVGAVSLCPGRDPSPVNTRWFVVVEEVLPPVIWPVRKSGPSRASSPVPASAHSTPRAWTGGRDLFVRTGGDEHLGRHSGRGRSVCTPRRAPR